MTTTPTPDNNPQMTFRSTFVRTDGGGVVVGDKVSVELEIEAVLRTA